MKKNLLAVLMICLIPSSYAKELSCHLFLTSGSEQNDTAAVTTHFISYLSTLVDKKVMTLTEVEVFKKTLEEKGVFINPLKEEAGQRTDRKIHLDNLQTYVDHSSLLDKDQVLKWLKKFLQANQKAQQSKKNMQAETAVPLQRMAFLPLNFIEMKQPDDVHLVHSVELMSTLVTQKMWMDEMEGKNPSHFQKGGDYPVENITLWSAMAFANKISRKHGLEPFYNLSVGIWMGRAEDGTLEPDLNHYTSIEQVEALLAAIEQPISQAKSAEGYRLPLQSEQRVIYMHFYRLIIGKNKDYDRLKKFVWVKENSEGMTHKVGQDPTGYMADVNEFSDILGNLFTQTTEEFKVDGPFVVGERWSVAYKPIGGSWDNIHLSYKFGVISMSENSAERNARYGFRLIRTLPNKKDGV